MRYPNEVRRKAVELFERGFAQRVVGDALGIPTKTAKEWLYTYRALGKEALFVTERRRYSYEDKLAAVRCVLEDGMAMPQVMRKFGIQGKSQLYTWCRLYRQGGPEALLPKRAGRPKKEGRAFASREEELEARVQELELEVEILKRIDALADEIERERRTR